jgi:ankyrin repeat protein
MHRVPNHTNVTALHIATISGFGVFVEHLLKYGWGEDIHKEDSLGLQPLAYACMNGDLDIVETLLGAGADPNASLPDGRVAALYGAAVTGQTDSAECLLDRDAEINATSDEYGTPLYGATDEGYMDMIRLLVRRGAKVNLSGGWHKRALNVAAFNGNLEAVWIMLDNGADIDPDEEYWYSSALGAAARRGHADVVKVLLNKGWSPTKQMETYGNFITAAATYGHLDVVEALVQKEARITVLEQALMAASQNGKEKVVKAILDRTPTLRHQKAFRLAADYGRDGVLKLLFPRGIQQKELDDALYNASDHEHEETVRLLLEFGADPNAEGDE